MKSDAELVERACRGDRDAFAMLISRYERTVLATAFSELRDMHAAEDVAQASLLLAFEKLKTLHEPARFGAWLLQITRRQVIDFVRRRRETVLALSDASLPDRFDSDVGTDWIEHEHLLAMLARLPEQEQLLMGLRYFEGLNMAEISEATGRPLGTVTKLLSRALARLRVWWIEE